MKDRAEWAGEQWRRERPDVDPFPMQILGRFAELAQRIERDHLNPLFADHGLRPGEFDVLATLRRSGTPYALTPTALYEALMITSGGMTNRVDRLQKAGLVERRKHPSDRRGVLVTLTGEGLSLIDRLMPLHVDNERRVLSGLGPDDQQRLYALLGGLLEGLEKEGG
ncbi:MarR family transcriptional regulator [Alloalcanivorax xenomutans]|uniref:MarR family winged helix-turn-helix transcriptional regulator n=1 Tax=Alloalcanivorax xenomutans TaxID=1094342 RepID=UPI000BCB8098|nr:MarR family transcriptional regulator [Alloalcanivorax xenomutans]SOC12462.1 MarR family transcriptional regulator [Alloalcanivorax xenomutans]